MIPVRLASASRFAKHLALTSLVALPRIAYRSSLSMFLDPRGAQKFMHQVLNAIDLEEDDRILGSKGIEELIDTGGADVQIAGPYYLQRSSDTRLLMELAGLAALVRGTRPRLIFEIGTFLGRTTRLLAANAPRECNVITLDLPRDRVSHDVGEAFRGKPESDRITQLFADSRGLDYSPWGGQCDFVWVDGCHDYEYVVSDTGNALFLCRPGGWIAWHDYRHTAFWSGVTRALRELKSKYPTLCHIRGTTIAALKKPNLVSP